MQTPGKFEIEKMTATSRKLCDTRFLQGLENAYAHIQSDVKVLQMK